MEERTLYVGISDIHISKDNHLVILDKLDKFSNKIKYLKNLNDFENVIIIVSGDITYRGSKEEYILIKNAFLELASFAKLLLCPGNHDHDFSVYKGKVREVLLDSLYEEHDDEIIEIVSKGQEEYRRFEKEVGFKKSSDNILSSQYELSDSSYTIQALNSAWCSKIKERGGDLYFPLEKIIPNIKTNRNIMFFHHPLSWFQTENQKEIRNFLRKNFSIVITGHEHEQDNFKMATQDNSTLFIEALSFDSGRPDSDGFYTFHFEHQDIVIKNYVLKTNDYECADTIKQKEVIGHSLLSSKGINLKCEFTNFLTNIGSGFIHSEKEVIQLQDLFIYPNVSSRINKKHSLKRVSTEGLLQREEVNNILLFGEESSGKTTLLKKYYTDLFADDYLPVFLNGSDISKSKNLSLKRIEKLIPEQYAELTGAKYFEHSRKKALLIDDFDLIKGDPNSQNKSLAGLIKHFDVVILTVSDSSEIKYSLISELNAFTYFDLLKIGFKLRYQLVNKWNKLKEGCQTCQKTLIYNNDEALKIITNILGKNYIPSNPFFLITILQSIDGGTSSDMNTSSYGYYYQYLITSSLGASSIKKEQLDELFNYIKELAYYFFQNKIIEEDIDTLWDFNHRFCTEYGLKIDATKRLDKLVYVKILELKGDKYSFRYPYIFYFFIAKYFSDNLNEPKVIDVIDDLICNMGIRKNSNILMFLTHHSKEQSILDKIIASSQTLFPQFAAANLDDGAKFIDDIAQSLPTVSYFEEDADSHKYRLKQEQSKDEIEEENSNNKDEEPIKKEEMGDLIYQITMTIRSLELLGQLAKNYYGSLKLEQKKQIIGEAIAAPLRAIESIFSTMRDNPEEVINFLSENIKESFKNNEHITKDEIETFAREAMFGLLCSLSYSFINKIASSVGNKHLLPVIEAIQESNNTNAIKLIHLAIKLDMGKHVTPESIKKIVKDIDMNGVSSLLTKAFVRNYLYMFEVDESAVQGLCKIAKINYAPLSREIKLERLEMKKSKK
jgi:calcineurin-like phosphoesterase family protein